MDNQVHNQIVSFIWGIADDCLRDVYVRGKYRDVILPMTVIRRLDAMLEETKPAVLTMKKQLDAAKIDNQWPALCNVAGQAFCNASPFLLKDLTSRAKAQTLKVDFIAYLDGFSPNVQVILDKFKFRNQIDTMIDADILGAVIEKFTSSDINLSPNPIYKDDAKTIIKHVGLDNHGMGTIFEELIRKFNEENNEEAGEHWTPRDVVELMADLVFVPIEDQIKDASYSCYDGACGTGGMLTVAQERLLKLAKERGKDVAIHLFGQEVNPETYAICTADMLLKGDGEEAEHIMYGSTLSDDQHASRQFDFMLSNPPYGKSWKTDAEKMGGKKEILDTRFNTYLEGGEAMPMIPRTSDGQLLFVLNNVAKMKKDTPLGSRIAEVHNGSSLFTGDAGSGESNARRYLIENDLVEAIIALPENMFYNTGIGTFIWILSNKKEERRKGKIQLIDASKMKSPLRKNMGKKNCEFTADIRADILRIFMEMEESEVSRIFNNDEFGYWSITVDRPLRQKVTVNVETIKQTLAMFKTLYGIDVEHEEDVIATVAPSDILSFTQNYSNVRVVKMPKTFGQEQTEQIYRMYMKALIDFVQEEPYMDYNAFIEKFYKNLHIKNNPFKFKKFEDFMYPLLEKDEKAEVVYDKGKPVVDMELRDTEIVPFTYEGGIDAFMKNEVLTYAPDAFVDGKKTTVGYEISFTKYFYKPVELREMSEILADLNALEQQADGMLASIMEGIL
jgi:type I restriction enzyme M protein